MCIEHGSAVQLPVGSVYGLESKRMGRVLSNRRTCFFVKGCSETELDERMGVSGAGFNLLLFACRQVRPGVQSQAWGLNCSHWMSRLNAHWTASLHTVDISKPYTLPTGS